MAETQEIQGLSNKSKLLSALGYIVCPIWIIPLILYFVEKDDKYVRFHALQGTILGLLISILTMVLSIATPFLLVVLIITGIGLLVPLLWLCYGMVTILLILVLAVLSYQGKKFHLPLIGGIAENYA